MKVILTILILLVVVSAPANAMDTFEEEGFLITTEVGAGPFCVEPKAGLSLFGSGVELKAGRFSGIFGMNVKEISMGYAKVLRGSIDADDIYIAFGKRLRIPFETLEPHLGMGAGLHILFSDDKSEERKLHGARFGATLDIGGAYKITDKIAIGPNIKYVFTVKKVYWHNPFVPHVHQDIFHYFIFNVHTSFAAIGR
ncbi:hypothetical protein FJZ31_38535 [Candidatus Poribacteria bacterium]|nr:hypothetical protein [Candidatus Poribacteria bacterium]